MSKWRQEGFVQDSDEDEDESQIESQHSKRNVTLERRVERVKDIEEAQQVQHGVRNNVISTESVEEKTEGAHGVPQSSGAGKETEPQSPIARRPSPARPTASPLTPVASQKPDREPTESPDPLQVSPASSFRRARNNVPRLSLRSPKSTNSSMLLGSRRQNTAALSSRMLGGPLPQNNVAESENAEPQQTPTILGAFGIEPLSDASSDSDLSDPPSDLESPEAGQLGEQPHRKTAVQVVIPASTALQRHILEQQARREFRQRKPIQLHPYALEGELYRREVQSRGLKPVARPRSPEQRAAQQADETQEQDFDPNAAPDSSPPELEIPVSTPVVRKPRDERPNGSSSRLSASISARRRGSSTQLRVPPAAKRRKLNVPLTQVEHPVTSIFDRTARTHDIRSIPPNSPPYSSSPLLDEQHLAPIAPPVAQAPNLPTPSTSSVVLEDPRLLLESDSDVNPRRSTPASTRRHRQSRAIISDQSSSASSSSSEAEQSDKELRKVGKKIKGVLPASWLRFDQKAQERRKAQARERQRLQQLGSASPEPSEPQRGVAKKILRRAGGMKRTSITDMPSTNVVIISDESDNGADVHDHRPPHALHQSAEDATALAAAFDRRYAADDSDDMENDRLNLFTLGGTGAKRKKQTKLTDSFQKAKRSKSGDPSRKRHDGPSKSKHQRRPKRAQRTPPPALSVVDVDLSPMRQNGTVPQFLRLARRQAIRRPDLARQTPKTKQLRLHNVEDTQDAISTLQQWHKGTLRPKANISSQARKAVRPPLASVDDNQQHPHLQAQTANNTKSHIDIDTRPQTRVRTPKPSGLAVFRRSPTTKQSQQFKKAAGSKNELRQTVQRATHHFRPGQLEEDENVPARGGHEKTAFEKGLRHAGQRDPILTTSNPAFMNPQLARFLADDDVALPPLPSAEDVGEGNADEIPQPPAAMRKRLIRKKSRTQRVDVDAREYRQPSEPTIQEVLIQNTVHQQGNNDQEVDSTILNGLGPYGTHYPLTFDISPLESDTYFHSSTLIGSEDLRCAFQLGESCCRNMDEPSGYCTIKHQATEVRCGPWNDETIAALQGVLVDITAPLISNVDRHEEVSLPPLQESLRSLLSFLRSLINYISKFMSFSDPIDRRDFGAKMHQIMVSLFDQLSVLNFTGGQSEHPSEVERLNMQIMTVLLVLSVQTCEVIKDTKVAFEVLSEPRGLATKIARVLIACIFRTGIAELGTFLEQNRRHAIREKGVQEEDSIVQSVVVCMHALERTNIPGMGFWDIMSQELSSRAASTTNVGTFESAWASLFTLLPFVEVDLFGLPVKSRREAFTLDNWGCISGMLKRVFELYPTTYRRHGGSLNDYVRTNLARCHRLIKYWHWQRPEQMLNAVFDFFGKNGLRQLTRETTSGSVNFFDHTTLEAPLTLEPNECSFHVALKCLVLGLRGMKQAYSEKKIRSFVFRTIPNHGRTYPKDQPLDEDSLAALRNHHDLLCTLYWAAPPPCRPKLELIRSLVSHESSHREACRVNVRAWANLATFQLSTEEPYLSAKSFASWHKDIMRQTLKQYRFARTEADDYLKSGVLDGSSDISTKLVRQAMERNQEQVIATLRDCVTGMRKAMRTALDQAALDTFLIDSDILHLMELPHLEDRRLVSVIRDTLMLLQDHAKMQKTAPSRKESQQSSEDSQDYGDFPDIDDLDDLDIEAAGGVSQHCRLEFVQAPLWRLLSNAFGAEVPPDDNLLMACIDTWILVAGAQVKSGARSWSYYLESFSQVSWQQLRATDQTRKFGPYFLACLVEYDSAVYKEHRHDVDTALLVSLVDRESLLRFQHRLLYAVVRSTSNNVLVRNLPFFYNQSRGDWDISSETVRTRRLALLSSLFSNMRDDVYAAACQSSSKAADLRRTYATMLKETMARMQSNYLQLQQGSEVTGSYVEFVQKVVQFLKQYTGDICPVLPFFTDSVAFPLPSTDPAYVVGRLCGYASKAAELGTAKQLSVFMQTVAQQAAADSQQLYLVNQLTTALCSSETPAADRALLRVVLFQGIFPAYLETVFSSSVASFIARPILHSLKPIIEATIFDLRITELGNVSSTLDSVFAILLAVVQGTDSLKGTSTWVEQPYALSTLSQMLGVVSSTLPIIEYISSRHTAPTRERKPAIVAYMEDLVEYISSLLAGMEPYSLPDYEGGAHIRETNGKNAALLDFSKKGLQEGLKTNWSESGGAIFFGQGQAKREIVFDLGSLEEERVELLNATGAFREALHNIYGGEDERVREGGMGCDVVV